MSFDGKAFGTEMTAIVKGYVDQATAPLMARIDALEKRAPEKGDRGEQGPPGESIKGETGVGVAGALIDRSGVLILTLSDGTQRDLGPVVGKDGSNGSDGLPGEAGADGRDGFSFEDFDVKAGADGRTVIMSFAKDGITDEYELKFPLPQYRQVFKQGEEYEPGDLVTWGGSLWHCNEKTSDKPDAGSWSLAVKKGRDGKDAK